MENSSRQDNKWWKDNSYMLLLGENNGGWWGQKNKSTAPSLTFPFAINLSKAGNKEEKADMC